MKTSDRLTGSEMGATEIDLLAADWLQRRHFWNWTDADQAALDAWLNASDKHRIAYLRQSAVWNSAERLVALRPFESGNGAPGGLGSFMRRPFVLPLLAAASIALVAFWGGSFVASLMQPPDRTDSTDVGGRTLLSFADRTEIELNTDTTVRTRMTTAERTVWLEKGEAWFHVAHDAAHPFTVIVGKHRITDLGTEFLVRRGADAVDVTVMNGRASLSADGAQTATLIPGEEAVATPTTLSVTRKTPQELADALAWRRGELVFRHARLSEVVHEFNRYNATKLVIADPSIADETVSADIRTDEFEEFLTMAQTVLGLRVDRHGNEFLISGEGQPETKDQTKRAARLKRSP